MSPTLAVVIGVVGLLSGLVSLLAIAVQLGRVLQRQDALEKASKDRADDDKEDARALQAVTASVQSLTSRADHDDERRKQIAAEVADLRRSHADGSRELSLLRSEIVERLIRIESHVERHTPAPAQPFGPTAPRHPTQPR